MGLAVLLLCGCGGQAVVGEECGPDAACAAGFTLDGVFYALSCAGIRPSAVREQVSADVDLNTHDTPRAVHRVAGAAGREILAVDAATTGCEDPGDGASRWSAAFSTEPGADALSSRLICDVGLSGPAQRAADGCPATAP